MLGIITGASRGIGAAVADRLISEGWQVHNLSRSTGFDVTSATAFNTLHRSNLVGAVVCCAGDVNPKPLSETSEDELRASLEVNLIHQFRLIRLFHQVEGTPPPIVLIGSTAGTRPSPGWAAYSVAKAALHNLGVTAHQESKGRVYVVAPGRCATDLRRRLAPDEDQTQIMQPSEVADVVWTCIQDRRGVLAGQVIEVARR